MRNHTAHPERCRGVRALPLLVVAAMLAGCSVVQHVMLRPDYDRVDRTKTVRLVAFTSPIPEGGPRVAQMMSEIALRYTNDHRDFIVKAARSGPAAPADLCAPGLDGVLRLVPSLHREQGDVNARVRASITRCRDGVLVWSADARGTFASDDPHLKDTVDHYVASFGPTVRPYVAPVFMLLKATLGDLPKPKLPNDAAVMEKIELNE